MKLSAILISGSLLFAANAQAQQCGSGKIVDMKEGGWNLDGLHIKLEGANANPSGADKRNGHYIYFDPTLLSAERMEGVRRIASLATATGKSVWTYSHAGTCLNASEISILAP